VRWDERACCYYHWCRLEGVERPMGSARRVNLIDGQVLIDASCSGFSSMGRGP
jgi:hypothetical protein